MSTDGHARVREVFLQAVELEPKNGNYWDTLGVVCYRGEQWEGAIKALQKSMELGNGESGNANISDIFYDCQPLLLQYSQIRLKDLVIKSL